MILLYFQTQTQINSYFQPENFIEPKKLKSVRLKRALKRFHNPPNERGSQDRTNSVHRVEESAKEETKRVKVVREPNSRQSTGSGKAKPGLCKNSKSARGRGKGKGKALVKKSQTSKKPMYRDEVNLSESSSGEDNIADGDDDLLANLDYESWHNDD